MATRTPTSYTVLGLLALGPKNGYELVQGYERSIGQVSSRAPSVIYAEPKKLVRDGLASAVHERRGERTVAVYSITDDGMDELQQWLSQPPEYPTLEAEPIVKTVFADFADLDVLRDTIVAFRSEARGRLDVLAVIGEEYLDGKGLYQDRLHIIVMSGMFVAFLLDAYVAWCDWALDGLDDWPDDAEGRDEWAATALTDWLRELGRPVTTAVVN